MIKYIPFLVALSMLLWGCKKDQPGFEMQYRRTFILPIGLDNFLSHNFEFKDISSDTTVFFTPNNATSNQIDRIEPLSMNIRALFGGNDNRFNIISRVEVWISDPSRPKLTPQIVFFRDDVPLNTGNRLDLIPNNVDVRPFLIEGSKFNLRINFRLRNIPDRSIDTEWNAAFFSFLKE
jgi:hypothetical protein